MMNILYQLMIVCSLLLLLLLSASEKVQANRRLLRKHASQNHDNSTATAIPITRMRNMATFDATSLDVTIKTSDNTKASTQQRPVEVNNHTQQANNPQRSAKLMKRPLMRSSVRDKLTNVTLDVLRQDTIQFGATDANAINATLAHEKNWRSGDSNSTSINLERTMLEIKPSDNMKLSHQVLSINGTVDTRQYQAPDIERLYGDALLVYVKDFNTSIPTQRRSVKRWHINRQAPEQPKDKELS